MNKQKTINEAIINRLLKFMGEKDISQYKLAQLSGIPYATIKSIMQRRTNSINLKTLLLLINGLDISILEFFNDDCFLAENLDLD